MARTSAPEFQGLPITEGMLIPKDRSLPPIPLKHTDIQATIIGPISHVCITQQFHNTHTHPIEAVYVFPLPEDAAVTSMNLTIGERTITGEIREREQAQREYEEAREAGQGAALLEQERPNMFTTSVANIQPNEHVQVILKFHDRVPYDDGMFTCTLPTVVLPRYTPADPTATPDMERIHTPLLPENMRDGHTLSIRLELDVGKLNNISSPSHEIVVEKQRTTTVVTLKQADAIPNKDFILRYGVTSDQFEAALFTYRRPQEAGTLLLMLTPQAELNPDDVMARELLFVFDRSGSMGGDSIVQAQNALRSCLRALNPGDTFNIFPFDDRVEQFSPHALPFTQENIDRADAYMRKIDARGGTEILQALELALKQQRDVEKLRIIVFLTDGAVGNEDQVLRQLRRSLNEARVYAFGIGSAVNRFLLDKLAEVGRGSVEYIFPGQGIEEAVQRFQNRAAFPLITDLKIDWGNGQVSDVYPSPLPDLYAGQPVTLLARFHNSQNIQTTIRLSGRTRRGEYQQTLDVELPASTPDRQDHWTALSKVWARARIDALMTQERDDPKQKSKVRDEILSLALEHQLLSPYTSFVAIEERRPEHTGRAEAERVVVPIHLPQGTQREAFEPAIMPFSLSAQPMACCSPMPAAPPPMQLAYRRSAKPKTAPGGLLRSVAKTLGFSQDTDEFAESKKAMLDEEDDRITFAAEAMPMDNVMPEPSKSKATSAERYDAALRYLARTQRVDGSWDESQVATSLALVAFLRGGHSDRTGAYRPQLTRTVRWLMDKANVSPVEPAVAWALGELSIATTVSHHAIARETAVANAQAHDQFDHICLTRAEQATTPPLPPLPDVQDERWTLAIALFAVLSEPIPDAIRSMFEQCQVLGGSYDGGVAIAGKDLSRPDAMIFAATAALATIYAT